MKKVLGILAVLVLVGAVALYLALDAVVKRGIEQGTSYATGVPTSVQRVNVGLLSGRMSVGRMEIQNPPGYESPYFFQLSELNLAVQARTLLEPTVRVPTFTIDGAQVNLERSGRTSNFNVILENLQRLGGKSGTQEETPDEQPAGPDTRFIIDRLRITDVSARAILARELQERGTVEVTAPPITLENVGADSGGLTLGELATLITREVLKAVSENTELPGDLGQQLTGGLDRLRGLETTIREEAVQQSEEAEQGAREELEKRKEELLEEGRKLIEPQ